MSIKQLTAYQVHQAYQKGELTPPEVVAAYAQSHQETPEINAFIEHFGADAMAKANALTKNQDASLLWGIPGALKDNISVKNKKLTCASAMLENYTSPYDSSIVEQLNRAQFINLGRLNMDEFAMGSTGRYSSHGATRNPLDAQRVAGGSSSGSAAAVAAHQALFTIGTDTGGSSRLPASYTGVCGFKPTYGAISRYGVNMLSPSFDVPGILAHTPEDIAMVYQSLLKEDTRDQIVRPIAYRFDNVRKQPSLKGVKIGLLDSLLDRADADVVKAYALVKQLLLDAGAELVPFDLGVESELIKVYYILMCSEAATTLSRFDGARYGNAVDASDIESLIAQTRIQRLGHEVVRRILMGNYFLMEENYAQWYMRALHIRGQLVERFTQVGKEMGATLWLWPGFHEAAMISAPERDNYASDIVAVAANLYGGPAVALPVMKGSHGLPVSVQIAGTVGNDEAVLQLADLIYRQVNWQNRRY
ncbi:amidase family protein [Entomospira culicis]|uniref:Asp-tRNA(Asn)/Glu-tRNA(Gln) amidotransferase subunit GatA n=1 Tax=Entomospira culicis TaxID=2719989 RepID=A0A968GFT8_9SPIO|nr:amidase family protein [Entomospira culicis]NIZ19351.1 Asp-tRNA(Asn)/Glu-tRNA(Gln) amidotransferase subunit GatA [Entomospira culicis]NIZ69744.1 Asp-tRNA(Asn)/Glu-tRNA(Gln) amidotransferase subunit GatA [Entomospira culicis]WDI36855.1 amidase family protein [Entomospira culicis]WDI38484.1 amidase family protein [Entomospira culicis]